MHLIPVIYNAIRCFIDSLSSNKMFYKHIRKLLSGLSASTGGLSNLTKLTVHCVAWPTVPYPGLFYLYCTNIQDFHLFIVSASYAIALRILLMMHRDSMHLRNFITNQRSLTYILAVCTLRVSNVSMTVGSLGCIKLLTSTLQQQLVSLF